MNLKDKIQSNIKKENVIPISDTNIKDEVEISIKETDIKKFKIGKKQEDKEDKAVFPLNTTNTKKKELDKICKKTKYSRNELINLMIDFCLENIEFEE